MSEHHSVHSEVVDLTKHLIHFKSTENNSKQLDKIFDFCQNFFSKSDMTIRVHEFNKKKSLVVLTEDSNSPDVFLVGHVDVVDASHKEFTPQIHSRRLYGRGAIDMKGQVAVMMMAMRDVYQRHKSELSLGMMLTTDEELGGSNGVNKLINEAGYQAKVAYAPDGGYGFDIVTTQKGLLFFKLIANKKAAHGSRPWEGESAVDAILDIYRQLKEKMPHPKGEEGWFPTINLGKINGGTEHNSVPIRCEAVFDLRTTEEHPVLEWEAEVKKISKEHGLEYERRLLGNVCHTEKNNAFLRKYQKISSNILGRTTKFVKEHGGSDARYFSEVGIPVVISSPIGGNIHGAGEWVDIDSLATFYDITYRFIEETATK